MDTHLFTKTSPDHRVHILNIAYYNKSHTSGNVRELDQPISKTTSKTGIAIARWYHRLFGISTTKIRIGAHQYRVLTSSLQKYIVRTSAVDANCSKQTAKTAYKAFKAAASKLKLDQSGTVKATEEQKLEILMRRHLRVMYVRNMPHDKREHTVKLPAPMKADASCSAWEKFFESEHEAYLRLMGKYNEAAKRPSLTTEFRQALEASSRLELVAEPLPGARRKSERR